MTATILPESFTHGSSEQRVGMEKGNLATCDTFSAPGFAVPDLCPLREGAQPRSFASYTFPSPRLGGERVARSAG
jgi:hypothetical protein